jgi:single-stranded-DNA-specific exonuclease
MRKVIRRRPCPPGVLRFPSDMPQVIQRIYAARGVENPEQLDYRLQKLCKPVEMRGLDAALALLEEALREQQSVLVVGDFDADGATSTVVAVQCLRAMGLRDVDFLVPNRFDYGYGLTPEIVEVAKQKAPQLIITVDNGISSLEGVAAAQAAGIKVLVTDHHLPGRTLPDADAIVNPNQPSCEFPSKNLAGVGVIFYLMSALRSRLRASGWLERVGLPEPNMAEYLDLVALGTVADVVPLDYNNRILVAQGLERMRAGRLRPGIRALLDVAGRSLGRLTAADLGFAVGPRLNAAGRLDDMSLGIKCLMARSDAEAFPLAQELNDLNSDRKQIEASMQAEALKALEQLQLDSDKALPTGLVLYQPGWHQGVIGILASRIKDRLHRPVIVFADDDSGALKGSGRSVAGIHLRDTLDTIAAQNPAMLNKFGGHAMAAGLSLSLEHLPEFSDLFDGAVKGQLGDAGLQAEILTDGCLDPRDFCLPFAYALQKCGPWGQHFPEPLFDDEFVVLQHRVLGGKHLKLRLTLPERQLPLDAIAFNADLSRWPDGGAERIHAVFKLDINDYRGQQSVQLLLDYFEAI